MGHRRSSGSFPEWESIMIPIRHRPSSLLAFAKRELASRVILLYLLFKNICLFLKSRLSSLDNS